MSTATISAEEHKRQIEAYQKEYPTYKLYADALKRVLEHGCAGAIPEALVQARPKGVASFAEKCVRKYDKYRDAVNQMTDLCGGRVILPTLEHVQAVKLFIERNFVVVERDDKSGKLGEGEFGYRDMHYLLRLQGRAVYLDVRDLAAQGPVIVGPQAYGREGEGNAGSGQGVGPVAVHVYRV